ncbi:hypothetical protein GH5_00138 [Leishmania sp. Ghana 2012 LV757]|uniref:hypothetical protein n=1 Tax=Leishmania sp. Ghana 2012 LV757 TaxID=2803181 RepID=UPI001B715E55|nr:hypothetical protein GH5_00138 [Leishmania sp. Ghana 2012 LV757]
MQPNASQTGRGSYATLCTAASAVRRPKTDYGISLEVRRRSEGKNTRWTASHGPYAAEEQEVQHLASPRWGGVGKTANVMQPTTPSTRAITRSLSSPLGQSTSTLQHCLTSPRCEKHVPLAGSDEDMDDAASALLSQLQQVVVRVSHQMVDERRRAAQQRKQIQALETIVAEQDAMLDFLRGQCDAAQYENSRILKSFQKEARRPSTDFTPTNQRSVGSHGVSEVRISAAQVDSFVCAEFRRLSSICESCPPSWFDQVSPIVAAVLRSLATEVLQMRDAARNNEAEASAIPHDDPPAPLQPCAARSSLGEAAPEPSSPLSMPAANRHTPVAGRDRAGVVDSAPPTAALKSQAQASVSLAAATGPSSAASVTAGRIQREKAELFRVDLDDRMKSAAHPGARAVSEASASVTNSIYEDAASILSDIRTRYGL